MTQIKGTQNPNQTKCKVQDLSVKWQDNKEEEKNLENYLRKKRYKTRFANTSIVMNAIGPSTEGKH